MGRGGPGGAGHTSQCCWFGGWEPAGAAVPLAAAPCQPPWRSVGTGGYGGVRVGLQGAALALPPPGPTQLPGAWRGHGAGVRVRLHRGWGAPGGWAGGCRHRGALDLPHPGRWGRARGWGPPGEGAWWGGQLLPAEPAPRGEHPFPGGSSPSAGPARPLQDAATQGALRGWGCPKGASSPGGPRPPLRPPQPGAVPPPSCSPHAALLQGAPGPETLPGFAAGAPAAPGTAPTPRRPPGAAAPGPTAACGWPPAQTSRPPARPEAHPAARTPASPPARPEAHPPARCPPAPRCAAGPSARRGSPAPRAAAAGGLRAGHLPGAEPQPPPVAAEGTVGPPGLVPHEPQQPPQLRLRAAAPRQTAWAPLGAPH